MKKEIVQKFLKELTNDKGLSSYGEDEVRTNLTIGAVDTLLLSEDLTAMRKNSSVLPVDLTRNLQLKPKVKLIRLMKDVLIVMNF